MRNVAEVKDLKVDSVWVNIFKKDFDFNLVLVPGCCHMHFGTITNIILDYVDIENTYLVGKLSK